METKTAVELFGEIIEYYIPDEHKKRFNEVLEQCIEIEAVQWNIQKIKGRIEYLSKKLNK